jgi:hypothetical protein
MWRRRQQLGDKNKPSGTRAMAACTQAGKCQDEGFLKQNMGDTYPEVECE